LLPLPHAIDEMQFAGFLRGKPLEMVQCLTSDIMVPAHADLVIEGYLDPFELCRGGDFGNHTGYYVNPGDLPLMHISCITRAQKPIFPATVVGVPPMEDCQMAKAAERIMLPFMRLALPEIVEINLPLEGIFHGAAIVSIEKRLPGQGRKVMEEIWSKGWLSGSRLLVVVDADMDVCEPSRVFWKALNCVDWQRDLVISDLPGGKERTDRCLPFGGRLGIDATRKLPEEGVAVWPEEVAMDEVVMKLVGKRWREYGFRE
jgi:4-hydroxy-3-polyprenylbenzoate decarboxylase